MPLTIEQLSIDCVDPIATARWWAQALGWTVHDYQAHGQTGPACGAGIDDEIWVHDPTDDARGILFVVVPEAKTVKNRFHLDLRPDDQATEVARLESLGAKRIDIGQGDVTWVVMADPDGNEFCVLSSRSS